MKPCKPFHDGIYPEREAIGMLCLRHHVHHRSLGSGICDLRLWHVTLAEMSLCCSLLSNELFWVTMKICPWVISQIAELEAPKFETQRRIEGEQGFVFTEHLLLWVHSGKTVDFFQKDKLVELWKRGLDVTKVTKPEECEHHYLIDL